MLGPMITTSYPVGGYGLPAVQQVRGRVLNLYGVSVAEARRLYEQAVKEGLQLDVQLPSGGTLQLPGLSAITRRAGPDGSACNYPEVGRSQVAPGLVSAVEAAVAYCCRDLRITSRVMLRWFDASQTRPGLMGYYTPDIWGTIFLSCNQGEQEGVKTTAHELRHLWQAEGGWPRGDWRLSDSHRAHDHRERDARLYTHQVAACEIYRDHTGAVVIRPHR